MIFRRSGVLALIAGLSFAGVSAAHAQSFGSIAQGAGQGALQSVTGSTGGTSGLLGSLGIPSLSSASSGNIAGLLGYCVQNDLVGDVSSAKSTLNTLTGRSAVTGDTSYASGQQGLLQLADGNQLSLSSLKGAVRKKVCKAITSRASSLL
ncbi:DUF2501 domain-containing protein [Acetobacter sp.]|jgi:hypothetical protein|uniref:DUF2501 domain-containing protein n=1 Tax=Acetobacter sp. TaxID=440 RepID=UPI0025C58F9D|nr:DUF2501 domain-containing protein [Acetobacter sp.]MCH4091505.1 DUF2501 domain-containing protein [Acetobacter sp.]MCI1299483.1 DUF2501 domain-containing protein [Acetobacter sp.]MCI1316927.1 DUF2501 domain-containing protein [Acetobacter sp.]